MPNLTMVTLGKKTPIELVILAIEYNIRPNEIADALVSRRFLGRSCLCEWAISKRIEQRTRIITAMPGEIIDEYLVDFAEEQSLVEISLDLASLRVVSMAGFFLRLFKRAGFNKARENELKQEKHEGLFCTSS